jgi:hypothetical protein
MVGRLVNEAGRGGTWQAPTSVKKERGGREREEGRSRCVGVARRRNGDVLVLQIRSREFRC